MRYRFQVDRMDELMSLPAAVADKHLKLAGETQLKVLLWLARFGQGDFDAAACAAATGRTKEDCEDGFCYWTEAGIISLGGKTENAPAAQPAAPTEKAVARPKAVKPQMPEVIAKKKASRVFSDLLDTASARFGRPISNGDMETLLYLYETAGLPAEVILLVIGYAKSQDKANMRYVEKVALDWADRDITTMVKAEAHLCRLERREHSLLHLRELFPGEATFRSSDVDYADIWFSDWGMADELVKEAYRQCVENIGKFNAKYIHAILAGWHTDGVTALSQVTVAKPTKGKAAKDSSLDMTEYRKNMQGYIPQYEKTKR